jgi:hypothetical protein
MIITMKKLKNISYVAAAFLVTTATSCKKQLAEYNPSAATIENQYTTPDGFTTLVNASYQDLHELYGNEDGQFECETGTDLWYSATRSGYAKQYVYYEGLASTQGQGTKCWQFCYRSINYCNTGISLIDKANFTDQTLKNARLAELRFLRALYYYHIVEQFGNVVLRTNPSIDGVNIHDVRSAETDFYDLMISDLQFAKDNLPYSWSANEYSRASKKSAAGLLARVYLTRAYYSTGGDAQQWFTKARDAAADVINNQASYGVSLYPTYNQMCQSVYATDRSTNKEAMFVISYNQTVPASNAINFTNGNRIFKWGLTSYNNTKNPRPGLTTAIVPAYGVADENKLMPTWHLLDLYNETIDARYSNNFQELWIANQAYTWATGDPAKFNMDPSVAGQKLAVGDTAMYLTKQVLTVDRTKTKYIAVGATDLYINPAHNQGAAIVGGTVMTQFYPSFRKFVNPNRTYTGNTDFGDAFVIRLAEMYLIAAEASVQLGDQASAAQYINVIRTRAALPNHQADMQVQPGNIDINFILDERAREFAGEQMRWYDLKRVFHNGQDMVNYVTKYNPDITLMQPFHRLRPIPQAELDAIDNAAEFGQNPGY